MLHSCSPVVAAGAAGEDAPPAAEPGPPEEDAEYLHLAKFARENGPVHLERSVHDIQLRCLGQTDSAPASPVAPPIAVSTITAPSWGLLSGIAWYPSQS